MPKLIILSHLRKAAGLTQREVARRMKVSQAFVWKMESRDIEELRIRDVRKYYRAVGRLFPF